MKRFFSLLVMAALLFSALPISAYASEELPDLMYEKPEMLESEESWVLYDGENEDLTLNFNANCQSPYTADLDGDLFVMFHAKGESSLVEIKAPYLAKNPISIDGYEFDELALRVQFYVSDPTVFQSNCQMELTSGGGPDKQELNFSPNSHFQLKEGWNSLYLPFSDGGENKGQLDVSNINYMRFYFFLNAGITMAFDNIMIVPMVDFEVNEEFSSDSAASKWTSSADLSIENGALKIDGNGAVDVSSNAYDLPIFKPTRTPIDIKIKASDPQALTSLSLILTDAHGNEATCDLNPNALQSNALAHYQIICSEMEKDDGFNFELAEKITLKAKSTGAVSLYLDDLTIKAYDSDYWMDWHYDYTTEPGEYSIAVIPDIQELSAKYPSKLNTIMQWIADNKEKENILFAIDLGDVTWNGHTGDTSGSNTEFTNARNAFDLLTDAGIDYSICYGNHDYTPGSSRDTTMFNKYFPLELFQGFDSYGGTMNEEKSDNTYYTFKGGNTKYLVLALEYTPDNKTLTWANEVVSTHPDHKVIVTTHGYMQGDSAKSPKDENELAPAVGADRVWNQLVKTHENIFMLLCGHAWSNADPGSLVMRRDTGENGNEVYQIMCNAQDIDAKRAGVGMLLMLRFSEDGNIIDFNYFSPVSGYAFKEVNQFQLALNDELSVTGLEDGATYCGPVSFTVNSKTTVTVKSGSDVLQSADGVYTVAPYGRTQRITIVDPFGETLASYKVKINDGHTGEQIATCTTLPVCEVCASKYGEYAEHSYGEDGICAECGDEKADDPVVELPEKKNSLLPILIVAAVVAVVGGTVMTVWITKKKKSL